MKEEIVTLETAKLAVEKGFSIVPRYGSIASLYRKDGEHTYYMNYGFQYSGLADGYIPAPTQYLLQKWLREKYNLHICIEPKWSYKDRLDRYSQPKEYYGYVVGDDDFNEDEQVDVPFKSYEDCLEDALIVALNSL